jgi:hypothetical protein
MTTVRSIKECCSQWYCSTISIDLYRYVYAVAILDCKRYQLSSSLAAALAESETIKKAASQGLVYGLPLRLCPIILEFELDSLFFLFFPVCHMSPELYFTGYFSVPTERSVFTNVSSLPGYSFQSGYFLRRFSAQSRACD